MRLRAILPLLIAALVVALPAAAPAATVSVTPGSKYYVAVLEFTAAAGERNDVTVSATAERGERRVVDNGAPVVTGRGCRPVSEHEAICGGVIDTSIVLGDGDDRVAVEVRAYAAGGAGDDLLVGSADGDSLDGGDGRDTILAGDGPDFVRGDRGGVFADTLSGGDGDDHLRYDRAVGVRVDLSDPSAPAGAQGEGDSQSGFESVTGGTAGASELIGTDGPNSLTAMGAGSRIAGGGGVDLITAGDDARIDGGPGNDRLGAGGGSRTVCGDGSDEISAFASGHLASDCERLPLEFVDAGDAFMRPQPKVRPPRVSFRIPCPPHGTRPTCRGRILLRDAGGRKLGKRTWTARRGRTPSVGVTLNGGDARRIAAPGGLEVRVSIIVSAGGYDRAVTGYSVTLTSP